LATKRNKLEAESLRELHGGHCPVCVIVWLGYLRERPTHHWSRRLYTRNRLNDLHYTDRI